MCSNNLAGVAPVSGGDPAAQITSRDEFWVMTESCSEFHVVRTADGTLSVARRSLVAMDFSPFTVTENFAVTLGSAVTGIDVDGRPFRTSKVTAVMAGDDVASVGLLESA